MAENESTLYVNFDVKGGNNIYLAAQSLGGRIKSLGLWGANGKSFENTNGIYPVINTKGIVAILEACGGCPTNISSDALPNDVNKFQSKADYRERSFQGRPVLASVVDNLHRQYDLVERIRSAFAKEFDPKHLEWGDLSIDDPAVYKAGRDDFEVNKGMESAVYQLHFAYRDGLLVGRMAIRAISDQPQVYRNFLSEWVNADNIFEIYRTTKEKIHQRRGRDIKNMKRTSVFK